PFRQTSFRPKRGIEFGELIKANDAYKDTFGAEVRELTASVITHEIRDQIARHEDTMATTLGLLTAHRLPGGSVLEAALGQIRAIQRGSEEGAIAAFNSSYRVIKDAIKRATELERTLTEPRLNDLERARQALSVAWPALQDENDLSVNLQSSAREL